MKRKDWNEIKNMSTSELATKLTSLQDSIFRLRFRNSTSQIKNPIAIRYIKKDIAKIKTLIAEKGKVQIDKNRKVIDARRT
ncbi:MAG: 50S ribosomal protein L29 [Endomicrobium sp.]|jgi:large subunit ribosomal protein L29|nr:50S ribosomal protein L29 [Endomicrobium sp.]